MIDITAVFGWYPVGQTKSELLSNGFDVIVHFYKLFI